jgi:FkbM family methyltransferase
MEDEDLIILDYFKNVKDGFYVDAGCYHPIHLNNTFLLHSKGWKGINIDLSEYSIDLFNYLRPDDININAAVSNTNEKVKFYYQKKLSQLTTLKKDVSRRRMQGHIKEKTINAYTLDAIIGNTKFKNKRIDFLNIDIEGADFEALTSLNFSVYRPKTICIEIDAPDIASSKAYRFLKNLDYKKIWSSKSDISHIFVKNF